MRKYLYYLFIAFILSSCAFHFKNYVSKIEITGENYNHRKGDSGGFYIHERPLIRLRLGCKKKSDIGHSFFLLIPIPTFEDGKKHESIEKYKFYLILSEEVRFKEKRTIDLPNVDINITIDNKQYPIEYKGIVKGYSREHKFKANLTCGEIKNAKITFLMPNKISRSYGFNFSEEFEHSFFYITPFSDLGH